MVKESPKAVIGIIFILESGVLKVGLDSQARNSVAKGRPGQEHAKTWGLTSIECSR
jgi:hypothetical protein